ncbi:MAG: hypothetical protein LBF50_04375 [Azoarcus sp.]|jgi:IS1 family transposase|nr:hypothetical protein [Azoarcus sp.]
MPGKIFGRNRSLIRWIREAGLCAAEPTVDGEITQIEFDEMWHFIEPKKETSAHQGHRPAAAGGQSPGNPDRRDSAAFRRLYDKVQRLKNCTFYTDKWDAFMKVPPNSHASIDKHSRMAFSHPMVLSWLRRL